MEGPRSSKGFYAWQSILKGREVLKRGARWKVGYSDNISMWNDTWLPSLNHLTVQSLVVAGFQEARVVDLINPVSHKWKPELIKFLFTP